MAISGTVGYVVNLRYGLDMIRVIEHNFDLTRNVAQSLKLNGSGSADFAILNANKVPGISWALSADGGTHWWLALPGTITELPNGSDVRWRAVLTPPALGPAPEISEISVQWGSGGIVGIPDESSGAHAFTLHPAFPNPFQSAVAITFDLSRKTHIALKVYDISGRLVRTLAERDWPAGHHSVEWNGRSDDGRLAASGVYYCRMVSDSFNSQETILRVP